MEGRLEEAGEVEVGFGTEIVGRESARTCFEGTAEVLVNVEEEGVMEEVEVEAGVTGVGADMSLGAERGSGAPVDSLMGGGGKGNGAGGCGEEAGDE